MCFFPVCSSDSLRKVARKGDPTWRGWPLPWDAETDQMPDVSSYAHDCVKFVKLMMKIQGWTRCEPRALPGQAQAAQLRSLEDRKLCLLLICFRFAK